MASLPETFPFHPGSGNILGFANPLDGRIADDLVVPETSRVARIAWALSRPQILSLTTDAGARIRGDCPLEIARRGSCLIPLDRVSPGGGVLLEADGFLRARLRVTGP